MHTGDAAKLFGLSEQRIRQYCRDGRIVSKRTGKPAVQQGRRPEWVIPDDPRIIDRKEWKEARKKGGKR